MLIRRPAILSKLTLTLLMKNQILIRSSSLLSMASDQICCLPIHGSYRPDTFLFKYFSRTFPGQITFFKGFLSPQFHIPGTCNQPLMQFKNPKDDTVTRCSHRLFCLCFSLFEYNLSALSPILETSIVLSHH